MDPVDAAAPGPLAGELGLPMLGVAAQSRPSGLKQYFVAFLAQASAGAPSCLPPAGAALRLTLPQPCQKGRGAAPAAGAARRRGLMRRRRRGDRARRRFRRRRPLRRHVLLARWGPNPGGRRPASPRTIGPASISALRLQHAGGRRSLPALPATLHGLPPHPLPEARRRRPGLPRPGLHGGRSRRRRGRQARRGRCCLRRRHVLLACRGRVPARRPLISVRMVGPASPPG